MSGCERCRRNDEIADTLRTSGVMIDGLKWHETGHWSARVCPPGRWLDGEFGWGETPMEALANGAEKVLLAMKKKETK